MERWKSNKVKMTHGTKECAGKTMRNSEGNNFVCWFFDKMTREFHNVVPGFPFAYQHDKGVTDLWQWKREFWWVNRRQDGSGSVLRAIACLLGRIVFAKDGNLREGRKYRNEKDLQKKLKKKKRKKTVKWKEGSERKV